MRPTGTSTRRGAARSRTTPTSWSGCSAHGSRRCAPATCWRRCCSAAIPRRPASTCPPTKSCCSCMRWRATTWSRTTTRTAWTCCCPWSTARRPQRSCTWRTARRRPRRRSIRGWTSTSISTRPDRHPPAAGGPRSEARERLQRLLERGVLLGEAEAHDALLEAAGIERRQRDRGHPDLAGKPAAERLFRLVADRRVVHALEIAALAGQHHEAGGGEPGAEQVALALIEVGEPEVRRRVGHVGRDAVLHRRVHGEHVELVHLAERGRQRRGRGHG